MYVIPIVIAYCIIAALELIPLARKKERKKFIVHITLLLIALIISLTISTVPNLPSIASLIKMLFFPILKQ